MSDEYALFIDGERQSGDDGATLIIDPATEQPVAEAPEASVTQAEAAAQAAAAAFPAWSATAPEARAELLDRLAGLVERHQDDLVDLVVAETGGTQKLARSIQVPHAAIRLHRYARGALEPTSVGFAPAVTEASALAPMSVTNAMAQRLPVGAVTCITSYNFPLVNMTGKIGPALAMGNTVVVKPAPQDPLAVLRLVELAHEAGFPAGVINTITSTKTAPAEQLTTSSAIDMVSFTGSTAVGRAIGATAGGDMKRLLLELGGKGACVVLDDADLSAAVSGIVSVWGFHSGQICTAPTRVVAHRSVFDELVQTLADVSQLLTVGPPREETTVVGPLITSQHRDRVEAHIQRGVAEGGELIIGGTRPDLETGFYVNPTLITGTNEMHIAREEIFGPVVVVVPFDDDDEAVTIANDSDYGLYDYIYTSREARAMRLAPRLRAGNVGINTLARHPETPFGGFKQSGVGRDGGSYGLHAYSELQSVVWSS